MCKLPRMPINPPAQLIDGFDRRISYLRLSVTDRCDFRCQYCMAETMQFLPRKDVLTIEELVRIARLFTEWACVKFASRVVSP